MIIITLFTKYIFALAYHFKLQNIQDISKYFLINYENVMRDKMAYQLYRCAKAIYFWQSGQASSIILLCILVTTDGILISFLIKNFLHMHVFKKEILESFTPKRTTPLLLSHFSIKTKGNVDVWLWQWSVLVHSQFATTKQVHVPVLVVMIQVMSGASLANNSQCTMCRGSADVKKTVIF